MKKVKFLLSVMLLLTSFLVISQELNGNNANSLKATETVNNEVVNYKIVLKPVKSNQVAVTKTLENIIGSGQDRIIKKLVRYGGTVAEKLNVEKATTIANQLRKAGAQTRVEKIPSSNPQDSLEDDKDKNNSDLSTTKKPRKEIKRELASTSDPEKKGKISKRLKNDGPLTQTTKHKTTNQSKNIEAKALSSEQAEIEYLVRLQSAGKNKKNVIKVVRELTSLGLRESKEIVDRLDIVEKNLSKKNAENYRRTLEYAGAAVQIETMQSLNGKD